MKKEPNFRFQKLFFSLYVGDGRCEKSEYPKFAELVNKIDHDDFSKKYFIGVKKENGSYNLLTSQGNYKVEIGDLDNIDLKVKGFKAFVEKFLIYQNPEKYSKVSVKYDNQIVTTLNPNFEENDSIISVVKKELAKLPIIAQKKEEAEKKLNIAPLKKEEKPVLKKVETKPKEKPKVTTSVKEKVSEKPKTTVKKETASPKKEVKKPTETKNPTPTKKPETKPKAKVKVE